MTETEAKWWGSLVRVLSKMPRTIELHARIGGSIGIAPIGARDRAFEAIGLTVQP